MEDKEKTLDAAILELADRVAELEKPEKYIKFERRLGTDDTPTQILRALDDYFRCLSDKIDRLRDDVGAERGVGVDYRAEINRLKGAILHVQNKMAWELDSWDKKYWRVYDEDMTILLAALDESEAKDE